MLAAMLQPLVGPTAAAGQATGLPDNVLQSSVRIITNIEVVPDDRDEDPFPCMLDEETVFEAGMGSGTIISEDGYILTNHHVANIGPIPDEVRAFCEDQAPRGRGTAALTRIVWLPNAKGNPVEPYRSELVRDSSSAEDLAVLRITEHADGSHVNTRRDPFPFVQFGDSDALREPETIILVGYPANAGTSRRVSEGIFSGWGDNGYGVPWIYTDATISGGNYGILIPGNIARVFAEEAIGEELPMVEPATPVDPNEPTPTQESVDPANADGPPFGEIAFTAYDPSGVEQDTFQNVNKIDGCFENLAAQHGQPATATWYLDDEEYLIIDFVWDDAWNPQACVDIQVTDEFEAAGDFFLDPGVYRVELELNGQIMVSDDLTVTVSTSIEEVSFRGRSSDGESVDAADGTLLSGEMVTIYADIAFTEMTEGSIWQAEWYLDGELVFASDPEVWDQEASGTETARLRNPERGPLQSGAYELVITIDGVESNRATVVIEN